jgi:hypothetical protein
MKERKLRLSWLGLGLILFGTVLLLRKLGYIDIAFHHIFWGLVMLWGIVSVSRGFAYDRRGSIFFGTVVFLYGLLFLLRSLESIDVHFYMFFPAAFLIFGIACLMMYLHDMRDWFLLVPTLFLCGAGVLLLLPEFGYMYRWEVWEFVHLYWPVGLILLGLAILFRRRVSQSRKASGESSETSSMTAG